MVQCHTIKVVERDNHIKVHSKDLSQLVHQHGVIGRENSYMVAWLVSVQYVQKVITLCSVLKVMKQDSSPSVSWRSDVVNDYVYPCRFPGEAPTVWAKRAFIITLVILWFVSVVIVPVFLSIYSFFPVFLLLQHLSPTLCMCTWPHSPDLRSCDVQFQVHEMSITAFVESAVDSNRSKERIFCIVGPENKEHIILQLNEKKYKLLYEES